MIWEVGQDCRLVPVAPSSAFLSCTLQLLVFSLKNVQACFASNAALANTSVKRGCLLLCGAATGASKPQALRKLSSVFVPVLSDRLIHLQPPAYDPEVHGSTTHAKSSDFRWIYQRVAVGVTVTTFATALQDSKMTQSCNL